MRSLLPFSILLACSSESALQRTQDAPVGSLAEGDLVITEIMASPPPIDPPWGWVEIQNTTGERLSLDGSTLFVIDPTSSSGQWIWPLDGQSVDADAVLVLGGPGVEPRPTYIDLVHDDLDARLDPYAGQIGIRSGDRIVDLVSYLNMLEGVSQGLDGLLTPDAEVNDALDAWCDATTEYADGVYGSPGGPNDGCPEAGVTCRGADGLVRAIQAPVRGDLVISEFMANPAGVTDALGEWFEVAVTEDVDLNGLVIGVDADGAGLELDSADCLAASAGARLLFARSDDSAENGGLEGVSATFTFSLDNSGPSLVVSLGGLALDELSWAGEIDAGVAWSLDEGSLSPDLNDDASAWCLATEPLGEFGDLGTPGVQNTDCAPVVGVDECLDGGVARPIDPPSAGDLYISEFMVDPAIADDRSGEWVELTASSSFDLNGLSVGTYDLDSSAEESSVLIDADTCLPVEPGARILLARSAEASSNGGLPWVDDVFSFNLVNTGGGLFLASGETWLDAVSYADGDIEAGASRAIGTGSIGPNAPADAWCTESEVYGDGDRGTPGAANLCEPAP